MSCLIVPLAPDETEEDTRALIASSGVRTVYYAVDSDFDAKWPERYGSVVRVRGFGVGRALDAAFAEAFKDGCQLFIRTDNHVYFPRGISVLGTHVEMAYHCTPDICFGASYPDPITYEFSWTWRPAVVPQTAEPVLMFSRYIVEEMIKRFGCVFCVEYWGAENYNATLTPCRLGIDCVKTNHTLAVHKYKRVWPARRVERRRAFEEEPWYREESDNTYFFAIDISYQIFLARHYKNPVIVKKYNPRAYRVALRYFGDRMRYIEGLDVFELYKKMGLSTA